MNIFSGDHGDQPQPGEIMLWEQWDDKPLIVINNDGEYMSAILVKSECPNERHAIKTARQQLNEWTESHNQLTYVRSELKEILDEIDDAKRMNYPDRLNDALDRLAKLDA